MANIFTFVMTVRGEDRYKIKELFERSAIPSHFGSFWNIPGYQRSLRCDAEAGDGITETPDTIRIKGECDRLAPVDLAVQLAKRHPQLLFEFEATDILNDEYQRWWFTEGEGGLVDCIRFPHFDGDEGIVYCEDGIQLLEVPDWIATSDRALHFPVLRLPEWVPQYANVRERVLNDLMSKTSTRNGSLSLLPVDLLKIISSVFPSVAISLSGMNGEECHELWQFKGGKACLRELRKEESDGTTTWFVKEGVEILPYPPSGQAMLINQDSTSQAEEDPEFLKELQDMG